MKKLVQKKMLLSLAISFSVMLETVSISFAEQITEKTPTPTVPVVAKVNQQNLNIVKNGPALALKIDRQDIYQLPRNFRTGNDKFTGITKDGKIPSRVGMDKMNVSASSTFSEKELEAILDNIPVKPNQFYDIDLRGESHGYINGTSVSWFADHNWGNDGRSQEIIENLEKEQLEQVKNSSPVMIYRFDDSKNVLLTPTVMDVNKVRTEEEMVKDHGANYFRLALSDHFRPEDGDVDKFLNFYKQLPKDAWLHYHCFAGMGRTTIFMVMHDILKNAKNVSFDDIIQRQKLIGIVDLSEIPDSKKNWGRKAYIERYQFVKHFYDYVKANPNLKKSWSQWAKEHSYETYTPDYAGYIWRIDAENKTELPRNFRTSNSNFKTVNPKYDLDANYIPSKKGLDTLNVSGSAQFSVSQFQELVKNLKSQTVNPIYIIDLRQESHGFFNNSKAVSWYGHRDWSNIDKTISQIIKDEHNRLNDAKNKTVITGIIKSDKTVSTDKENVKSVLTEKELVERAGLNYVRITATDHVWPSPENIDQFINLYKKLPQKSWLHFHCEAGEGRTTTYMAIYDMMKNPDVSLKDILYRQHLLGGNYVAYTIKNPKSSEWKADYYHQKAQMINKFYQYVQENHQDNYQTSWSDWLKTHE